MRPRTMLYCQHLAGIGHLIRSTELARALATDGWEVLLVCGGDVPRNYIFPAGVKVERLEALKSDAEYQTLMVCEAGQDLNAVKVQRATRLLALYDAFSPDVLVTEMYPFGRKKFAFELQPLLERARNAMPRPLIAASVRDILVRKRDQESHEQRVLNIVNRYYDAVLVHSDEQVQPLSATFAAANKIRATVTHTGYVVANENDAQAQEMDAESRRFVDEVLHGNDFVLVSCGSGRLQAARHLTVAALESAEVLGKRFPHKMVVCAGPLAAQSYYEQYEKMAAHRSNVVLVHDLPYLRRLMGRAALSVSLGGYNTVMELLAARVQALVLAAEPNGDTEQRMRVEALAAAGQVRMLDARDLIDGRLATRIEEALLSPLAVNPRNLNGARMSARILNRFQSMRASRDVFAAASIRVQATESENEAAGEETSTLCA